MEFSKELIKEFEAKYDEGVKATPSGNNIVINGEFQIDDFQDKEKGNADYNLLIKDNIPVSINFSNYFPNKIFKLTDAPHCSLKKFSGWQIINCETYQTTSEISNKSIFNFNTGSSKIESSIIGRVLLNGGRSGIDVEIVDSLIGVLEIINPIRSLKIKDSRIQNIITSKGSEDSSVNDVVFENVVFETSFDSKIYKGEQGFRDFRSQMEKKENSEVANVMRVHELRSERKRDEGLTKLISWVYDLVSEYGTNATRAFAILIASIFITIDVVCYFDWAVLGQAIEGYKGWQVSLYESNIARSVFLTLQSLFNPAGIFGYKNLVVASNGLAHLFVSFMAFFNFIFLLTTIFSIRKRFKLH